MTKFPNLPNDQIGVGNKNLRHPERSEANDFRFSQRPCPSVVEGPSRFDSEMTAMDSALFKHSHSRRRSITTSSVTPTAAFRPPGSFDFGSAGRHGKTNFPLAFAQDDGALVLFLFLVPKLYLGTHLYAQFHCPTVTRHTRVAATATSERP